jgi:hypothetical protein
VEQGEKTIAEHTQMADQQAKTHNLSTGGSASTGQ